MLGYRLTKRGYHPIIQTASVGFGLNGKLCMKRGRKAQSDFAGIRLIWLTAYFGACRKVVINRFVKDLMDFLHSVRVKADYIIDSGNMPDKASIIGTETDNGGIALICNSVIHGSTPNFARNVFASLIWYGAASFLGCGLWKYPMTSSRRNLTREPSPSITSQPIASRRASISAHTIVLGVGLEKIAARVFRCLLFMMHSGIQWWLCQGSPRNYFETIIFPLRASRPNLAPLDGLFGDRHARAIRPGEE
jgi:hypothetical protein